jgi:hypothetical protein
MRKLWKRYLLYCAEAMGMRDLGNNLQRQGSILSLRFCFFLEFLSPSVPWFKAASSSPFRQSQADSFFWGCSVLATGEEEHGPTVCGCGFHFSAPSLVCLEQATV